MNEVELGLGALIGVAAAAVAATTLMMLIIRRWSDQEAIARTKAQAQAHLLECRLFREDPAQVLRSQRALILDNARLLRFLLPALGLAALPAVAVLWTLDAVYGRAPLIVGQPAVVTADSRQDSLVVPPGYVVETKPVFATTTGHTGWRVRPTQASSGILHVGSMTARIAAGSGPAYLPGPLLGSNAIEIQYPRARILSLSWVFWFTLVSLVSALLLRGPLRVAF